MKATEKQSAEVEPHDKWEPFKWSKFVSKYFELIMGILNFVMFATAFTLLGYSIGISSQPNCEAKHLSTENNSEFPFNLISLVTPGEDIEPYLRELDHPVAQPDLDRYGEEPK